MEKPPTLPCDAPPTVVASVLAERGVVHFRLESADLAGFRALTERFTPHFTPYLGGARTGRTPVDDTGTVLPVTGKAFGFAIPMHGEMCYQRCPPDHLWFWCRRPAREGGHTWVADGVAWWKTMPQDVQTPFLSKRLAYHRFQEPAVWGEIYGVEDEASVLKACQGMGLEAHLREDGVLATRFVCSALRPTAQGPAFVNNLLPFVEGGRKALGPLASRITWEDGSPLEEALVDQVAEASHQVRLAFPWVSGDVLMIDNGRVVHGRDQILDPDRDVVLRLGYLSPQT